MSNQEKSKTVFLRPQKKGLLLPRTFCISQSLYFMSNKSVLDKLFSRETLDTYSNSELVTTLCHDGFPDGFQLKNSHCTCTLHCTLHTEYHKLNTLHITYLTLHSAHCTVNTAHFTLYLHTALHTSH